MINYSILLLVAVIYWAKVMEPQTEVCREKLSSDMETMWRLLKCHEQLTVYDNLSSVSYKL